MGGLVATLNSYNLGQGVTPATPFALLSPARSELPCHVWHHVSRHTHTLRRTDANLMLQASLRRNPAPDPRRDPASVGSQLGALKFETGQKALFLGRAYYGCVATILPPVTAGLSRKVKPHWPVIIALDLLVTFVLCWGLFNH